MNGPRYGCLLLLGYLVALAAIVTGFVIWG